LRRIVPTRADIHRLAGNHASDAAAADSAGQSNDAAYGLPVSDATRYAELEVIRSDPLRTRRILRTAYSDRTMRRWQVS
jgi:hypothetical protein